MVTPLPEQAPTDRGAGSDIRVAAIAKGFGNYPALHGVDLDIARGELVALLGPSGSGKTTLLRIIAGLERPDSGTVMFDGEDATGLRVQDRRVGLVFQHYALFRHMTVYGNVAYGLRVRARRQRPPRAVIRERVRSLLDLVQLAGFEDRYPVQLSGGQRQRVALARALAIEPKVLLLDEPFGALDAKVRKDLRRWLRDFHRASGLTTIFVTHDQDEAMEIADRVAVLNEGRIEQVGSPDDLYERPASPFVMSFIGETVAVEVVTRNGVARIGGQRIHTALDGIGDGPSLLYLRPGEISITAPGPGTLAGRVGAIRRTAAGYRVEVAIDGLAAAIDVLAEKVEAKPGDRIGLALARTRLFPGELRSVS